MTPEFVTHPAFLLGKQRFECGEWFEAHEEWELLWRPMPAGEARVFVQGLIQLAVSLEHHRRNNPRGSQGQREKAESKLRPLCPVYAGVEIERLLASVDAFLLGQATALPQLAGAPQLAAVTANGG